VSLSDWSSLNMFDLQGSGGISGQGGSSFSNPGGNGQAGTAGASNF
jgi:hypothetical protein